MSRPRGTDVTVFFIMSYLDTKRFIDEQVKLLNHPVIVNDEIRDVCQIYGIPESTMRSVLFKSNLQIKRNNRSRYSRAKVHQTVQQILAVEKELCHLAESAPVRVQSLLLLTFDAAVAVKWPLAQQVDWTMRQASYMPEGKFLFGSSGENLSAEKGDDVYEANENEVNEHNVKENRQKGDIDSEKSNHFNRMSYKAVLSPKVTDNEKRARYEVSGLPGSNTDSKNDILRERYDQLRKEYLQLQKDLVYRAQKLDYLRDLAQMLCFAEQRSDTINRGDVEREMRRFSILVEKLSYSASQ